ncbi:hypothetical protein B0H17DRAFT_1194034 [Mycena rosella]|uniref:Uncharacterized protein n=1 Tax=Mycena rosella TaxID=1033263 RepID=A0AAD7E201_MYCRO|nr:hypothetical protein B0H17DRAFT_1194034 [Mycena rosella]
MRSNDASRTPSLALLVCAYTGGPSRWGPTASPAPPAGLICLSHALDNTEDDLPPAPRCSAFQFAFYFLFHSNFIHTPFRTTGTVGTVTTSEFNKDKLTIKNPYFSPSLHHTTARSVDLKVER